MTTLDKPAIIHGLLVAAGASRRLGQPKQLVKFNGKYLINHTIEQLNYSELNDLKIILGCKSDLIITLIDSVSDVLINKNWESGMGSSISLGVGKLNNNVDGVLVSLVDQYHMTTEIINALIKRFNDDTHKLIISHYSNGIYGPPAIFPRRLFDELKTLDGESGAGKIIKYVLANNPDQVTIVDFENGHIDIDTPADLLNLTK